MLSCWTKILRIAIIIPIATQKEDGMSKIQVINNIYDWYEWP